MSDKDMIEQRRADFISAFNSENLSAMESYIADNVVAMPPNRPMLRGKDAWRSFIKEGFAAAKSRLAAITDEVEIKGDTAIDQFLWTMDSTPKAGGAAIKDKGKCVWVWLKQKDGSWQQTRAIWNSDLTQGHTVWTGAPPKT